MRDRVIARRGSVRRMSVRCFSVRRLSARCGITLLDVVALAVVVLILSAFLVDGCYEARGPSRQNTCRSNLRQLAMAVFQYASRSPEGTFPGTINALERDDGYAYHDPRTKRVEPVSWVVMIFPEVDRQYLAKIWRSGASPEGNVRIGSPPLDETRVYLEYLVCPGDRPANREGTPLSYVVNGGIPDFSDPSVAGAGAAMPFHVRGGGCACAACGGTANLPEDAVRYRPARDLAANGLFFDEFTPSRHFDPVGRTRPVASRISGIVDPKEKTILMTENVDAVDYTLDPNPDAPNDEIYPTAERKLAVTWVPTSTLVAGESLPILIPLRNTFQINSGTGTGDGGFSCVGRTRRRRTP